MITILLCGVTIVKQYHYASWVTIYLARFMAFLLSSHFGMQLKQFCPLFEKPLRVYTLNPSPRMGEGLPIPLRPDWEKGLGDEGEIWQA